MKNLEESIGVSMNYVDGSNVKQFMFDSLWSFHYQDFEQFAKESFRRLRGGTWWDQPDMEYATFKNMDWEGVGEV